MSLFNNNNKKERYATAPPSKWGKIILYEMLIRTKWKYSIFEKILIIFKLCNDNYNDFHVFGTKLLCSNCSKCFVIFQHK